MTIDLKGCPFELLYEKAMYKPDESLLIIADIHLGKASHFRKEGISIPSNAQMSDYDQLEKLFIKYKPQRVYFLGDLFHSTFNRDWHYFCDLLKKFPAILFVLIKGNHDIINAKLFRELCVDVVDAIEDGSFIFTHEPLAEVPKGKINIAGHIHPGITISGLAKQNIKLPCFYITNQLVLLPAFGVLTGLYSMDRSKDACAYLVLPDGVKRL